MIVCSKKVHLPWIGPYYVCKKLSQFNVKLRRVSDNKPVKNRIHFERLKPVYLSRDTSNLTFDATPLSHADSLTPAIVNESELLLNLRKSDRAETTAQDNAECPQAEANNSKTIQVSTIDDAASDYFNIHKDTNIDITRSHQSDSQDTREEKYWEIEKIIAKRIRQGEVEYRVKWLNFDSKFNSWVKYDNLSDACK